jgi:4-hydroxybenzoyl-CoA reductase subunit beta
MRLPFFEYHEPASVDQALRVISERRGTCRVLAGGTELLPLMKLGLAHPSNLVSLSSIAGLSGISSTDGMLRIGAMTTLAEVAASAAVRQRFTALYEAVESVAAPPIRNGATVAGNLCQNSRCLFYNQSDIWRKERPPCFKAGGDVCLAVQSGKKCFSVYQGDLAPSLIALGARVTLQKESGSRTVPCEALFSGEALKPIALDEGEFVTEILLDVPRAGTGSAYRRLSVRSAIDYPLVSAAACLSVDRDGKIEAARVLIGAAGPAPLQARETADMLLGKKPHEIDLREAGQSAGRGAQIVDNLVLPASYRRKMIPVIARRAIEAAIHEALEALRKERSR